MSASLGKKICGLIVVDENGNKLTPGKGFARAICRMLSGMILGIGYIIALFDDRGKALHDRLAGTFVTSAASLPAFAQQASVPFQNSVPPQNNIPPQNNGMRLPSAICVSGPFAGKAFSVMNQGITFGRDANLCEVVYSENAKGISRIHCKLLFNPQSQMFILYDMGSSYGTFLDNGKRVLQDQPVALRPGEGFYLASNMNSFRVSL